MANAKLQVIDQLFIQIQQITINHHSKSTCSKLFLSEPDGAPQNVRGQKSSSRTILVMWTEVPAAEQNGIITGYTITYKSQTENDNGNVAVNGSVYKMELTSLKENVNYNITVFASTVKGDGPASDNIVVRTDQDSKFNMLPSILSLLY